MQKMGARKNRESSEPLHLNSSKMTIFSENNCPNAMTFAHNAHNALTMLLVGKSVVYPIFV